MRYISGILAMLTALACALAPAGAQPTGAVQSLAGKWAFRLDPGKVGHEQKWYVQDLPDRITLPGSTDQAGYGTKTEGPERGWLSRPYKYEGPAWYQKQVTISPAWAGKRITLFLERCHWQTEVWVDGKPAGMHDSLCTPHVYDLSALLPPGIHRLTICVDNTYKINVGRGAHSVTEYTQTNWNGIVGRIELQAQAPVWIDSIRVFPNAAQRTVRAECTLGNHTGWDLPARLTVRVLTSDGKPVRQASAAVDRCTDGKTLSVQLPMSADAKLWDEFHPNLYRLEATLTAGDFTDTKSVTFGLRDIATRGTQFTINGRPTFLRGTLECCIFPLTGYPPTDVASWLRIFRIARSYGLNHFRFHSWCPPEAAFTAADETGFMLHVETPVWTVLGSDPAVDRFIYAESDRILRDYGNHPSFTMLCVGNEPSGPNKEAFLSKIVAYWKQKDPRRLYTSTSGWGAVPEDDYLVAAHAPHGALRLDGRFGREPSSTDYDFSAAIQGATVPYVCHELGQWVVYPDFREIAKYTGVLKPRNLEVFRDKLATRGMSDENELFHRASGAFAWLLYKEDIETALRTPNFGGFQLLQLHDFPGQGEALVGLLDPFWESKGILTPEQFREFCSETVPLLRFPKYTWTNDETFTAKAEVAHYGAEPLRQAVGTWSIRDDAGQVIASGSFPTHDIATGGVTPLGAIKVPLSTIKAAERLTVTVSLQGTAISNHWDIWVYPKQIPTAPPADVTVTADVRAARTALAAGRKVLLLWPPNRPGLGTLENRFLPVFWSFSWFPQQPGTLGILCDPRHPALAEFPTDFHSNFQWWEITQPSVAFILDDTPANYRPIVQVIDDFHRNHKLGAVFETRVGAGKLLVSGLNLQQDPATHPVARQMLHSLLDYMHSDRFQPSTEFSPKVLDALLAAPLQAPVVAAPRDIDKAAFDVKAAANLAVLNQNTPWEKKLDAEIAAAPGYGYDVSGAGTWKDAVGSAWHGGAIKVTVTCPRGVSGTLYAHFHDWNNQGRSGWIEFGGKRYWLADHTGAGRWIALKVTPTESGTGHLVLTTQCVSGPNLMITQVAFVER